MRDELPIAVIGAGPAGLAAASHLHERGLRTVILEAGTQPAAAVRAWGHVRLFSPWRYCIDEAARRLLTARGWQAPPAEHHPTGAELVAHYLEPLAATPAIAAGLRLGTRVRGIARHGIGRLRDAGRETAPFRIWLESPDGGSEHLLARAVIDATGTWERPAPAGADGLPALGERTPAVAARLRYGQPDVLGRERRRYAGRRVAVLGAGHSAAGALIDLVTLAEREPGTEVVWLRRRSDPAGVFGGGARDALPARGALGLRLRRLVEAGRVEVLAPFRVEALSIVGDALRVAGRADAAPGSLDVDQMVVAAGFRPDLAPLSELRLELDPKLECPRALAPLIDPNLHSCGTVPPHGAADLAHPEGGFYIAGMKSYGRAPTFLLLTGYEQVRSIAAELAGDHAAARDVRLVLPKTGVCTTGDWSELATGCCGGPAAEPANSELAACCLADAAAKSAGRAGCGCPDDAATGREAAGTGR